MAVTRRGHFQLIDRLVGGDLVDRLVEMYAEAGSWEGVSRRLYASHEIAVSGQTLRRWARELGIGADTKAAS